MEALLELGADPYRKNKDGQTPLDTADYFSTIRGGEARAWIECYLAAKKIRKADPE